MIRLTPLFPSLLLNPFFSLRWGRLWSRAIEDVLDATLFSEAFPGEYVNALRISTDSSPFIDS